jgi:hypothetical protein
VLGYAASAVWYSAADDAGALHALGKHHEVVEAFATNVAPA